MVGLAGYVLYLTHKVKAQTRQGFIFSFMSEYNIYIDIGNGAGN